MTSSHLVCGCNHLSDFAGQYCIPHNPVDIFNFEILYDIRTNPVVLIVVLVAWSLHLLVSVWAHRRDKKDHLNVGIHTCAYLKKFSNILNVHFHNTGQQNEEKSVHVTVIVTPPQSMKFLIGIFTR